MAINSQVLLFFLLIFFIYFGLKWGRGESKWANGESIECGSRESKGDE